MRITKRILAIVLAALMAISMMPFAAFAAEEPTVTWDAATENIQIGEDADQSNPYDASYTKDAITVSATSEEGHTYIDGTRFSEAFMGELSGFVFTNSVANFSKIKLVFTNLSIVSYNQFLDSEYNVDPHWSSDLDSKTVTWEGDSNSVGLYAYGVEGTLDRIEFTYEEPAPAEPVSYKDAAYDSATNTVTYTDATCDDYTVVAADTTTFEDGKWYVVNSNVTVNGSITVNGAANLILADGYTLTVTQGVAVTDPNSLTIFGQENGTGTLTATGGDDAAGIGGINGKSGPITINGGTINATGVGNAAGIGASDGNSCGDITINGGTVNASASSSSNVYCIGDAGWASSGDGTIAIHGGTVNVNPGEYTYGIGYCGNGTINITGGVVNVNKDKAWATGFKGGNLNVSGGEVYAVGSVAVMSNANFTGGTFIAESLRDNNPAIQSSVSIASGLKVLLGSDEASATEVEPSFINYNSSPYWNANPKWIKIYPAPAVPTATVTPITVDGFETAYSFKADETAEEAENSAYKDYIADFEISFDKDVKAGAITLGGSYEAYNNGEWVSFTLAQGLGVSADTVITAGTKIKLLNTALANQGFESDFTYYDVASIIKEFKCGAKGLTAQDVTMNVAFNLYEDADAEPLTIAEEDYTFPAGALPTVNVTPVTGAEKLSALDVEYLFSADDDADSIQNSAYKDYIADFVITFDKDIEAGDVKLSGSYEAYDNGKWVEFDVPALAAGEEYRLLENAVAAMGEDYVFTYEDICTLVKEFKCGARGLDAAGVTMNVALNLYENATSEPETIADEDYTFTADATLPQVEVTPLETDGLPIDLETAYTFKAVDTEDSIANSAYRSHIADFVVSFDKDIEAGDVKLAGSYQGYKNGEWVEFELPALAAGEEYRLLENAVAAMGEDYVFTYEDICTLVKEFKCGAKGLDAAGVKMTVALNLYETDINGNELGEVTDVADTEYTFIEPEAIDKYSITISDAIDMNIYIANNVAGLAAIRYTFNGTPEEESNQPTVETISGADLTPNADNYFEYSITLAPAQIEDTITVELLDSNGELLRPAITTSIANYCKQLRDNDNLAADLGITDELAAEYKELAKATLDYGKAAAEYFNYYNKDAFEAEYNLNEADFSVYDGTLVANASGVGITQVSYRALSVPSIRFVLNMTEAEASKLSVSSNIGNASLINVGGKVVLDVAGIPASQLDDALTITFSNGAVINYTPIVYAKKAAEQGGALGTLGSAIANYNQAASAVFAD